MRLAGNLTWAGWKFFSQPTLNFSSQPTLRTAIERHHHHATSHVLLVTGSSPTAYKMIDKDEE
jgi:hypothetical protein